jgi:Cu(I)/Ag(I) efflux system membrane fusion protein
VAHGLDEGDLVVTNGNFKIDSEIQLQARPSMMTPEGSGAAEGEFVELPLGFRRNLRQLVQVPQQAAAALKDRDLAELRATFQTARSTLAEMPADSLDGDARLVWKELAMLLGNDAFEASGVKELPEAERLVKSFQHNMQRLDAAFHIARQLEQLPARLEVPPAFQAQLAAVWRAYAAVGDALAGDDFELAKQAAAGVDGALSGVDMKLLADHQTHMAWMREHENLKKVTAAMAKTEDIEALRAQFEPLSGVIQVLALQFGFGDHTPVYLLHCPMAFANKGAVWFQQDDQVRNPYFGSTMLKCADRVELIAGRAPSKAPSQEPDK